ncbi:MAG TPA: hypothetical protein VGQ36_17585 [Thermoanaerobaculia bacterium]|jgi:hypothetical protein|nr:hypothetical protein [Thermoanaerobaculia bacterium]
MLVIRQAQLSALADAKRRAFEDRCASFLRTTWPEDHEQLGEDELRGLVRERSARAADFGLTTERDIQRFLNLSALLGHDFEWQPRNEWIVTLLRDSTIPFPGKLEIIYRVLGSG